MAPRTKKSVQKELTVITDDKIYAKCSTKTFIAKSAAANAAPRMSVEELLDSMKDSYRTKFRNCVIKKLGKICVKVYTNKTVQITGAKNLDDIPWILSDALPFDEEYEVVCVMSNWSINLENDGINLDATMSKLNDAGVCSYFLRGYPLVNKYETTADKFVYQMVKDPATKKYHIKNVIVDADAKCQVSMLMFKSGTCIISGTSEKPCIELLKKIRPLITKAVK